MGLFGGQKRRKPWQDLEGFELPRFSATTLQTLEILRSDESSARELADVIERDPALSVRILGMVNSAAFGARRSVEDLAHAVQLVGRAPLERLVISLAVQDALPADVPGFDAGRFWQLSARRAAVARGLAALLCPSQASIDFTAAMLSDMAVPLLALRMGGEYVELLARRDAGEGELWELEIDAFGWEHGEAGAWMGEQWELPEVLVETIRSHHSAPDSGADPRGPVALAGALDESDPEKDAARVAELAAREWEFEAPRIEAQILQALAEGESEF